MDQISIEIIVHDFTKIKEILKTWQEIKDECQLQADTHFKITVA